MTLPAILGIVAIASWILVKILSSDIGDEMEKEHKEASKFRNIKESK